MAIDPQTRSLARRLARLEKQALQRKQPSLGFSAIDDGAIQSVDQDGLLRMIIGLQHDGTQTAAPVAGPPPPRTAPPLVIAQAETLRIYWDGTFEGGAVAPMDFARVLAYAVPLADFNEANPLDPTTIVGQFDSATGSEVTAGLEAGVEYAVFLVCWSQAGRYGEASDVALGTPLSVPTGAELDAISLAVSEAQADALQAIQDASAAADAAAAAQSTADGKIESFYQSGEPGSGMSLGDLWIDTDNDRLYRYDGSDWIEIQDAGIAQAIADAANAQSTADGKITTFYQDAQPSSGMSVGDLWFDTNDDNHPHYYNGSGWTSIRDATIAEAQASAVQAIQDAAAADNAASAAQATADGKITTFYQAAEPSSGMSLGDLWIDSDNDRLYRYNGTDWVEIQDSAIAQAISDAADAQSTADGKIETFYQASEPTSGMSSGDLWFDTNDGNHPYYYDGSDWVSIRDGAIPGPPTDGVGPASSPKPEVIGGIGAFYLRWAPPVNADPMRFEVHVSDAPSFTPSSTTLYSETSGYSMTVRHLPRIDPDTGDRELFAYETPYYFRIIAMDDDDAAPAGAVASAVMFQVNSDDIGAEQIFGTHIRGGTITGDLFSSSVTLSTTISTGALDEDGDLVGARIDLGPGGFFIRDAAEEDVVHFPMSEDGEASIKAHMKLLSADVEDNFTMHGTNNAIAEEAQLVLAEGVTAPNAPPQVTQSYDTIQLDTTTATGPYQPNPGYNLGVFSLNPAQITSMDWNPSWGGFWAVIQSRSNGLRIWRFNADGSLKNNPFESRPWVDDYNGNDSPTHCTDHNPNVTTSGDSFMYRNASGDWYIWGSAPNGTNVINKIPSSWVLDSNKPPDLSYDQTSNRYMLSQSNNTGSNDRLHVRRFHCVTGSNFPNAVSDGVFQAAQGTGLSRRNNGLVYGTQVVGGGNRYAWSTDDWATVYVVNTSGVRRNTNGAYEEWTKPGSALGFCHDGTRFASVDATGRITLYTDWTWPESGDLAHVGVSAYDSDTAGDKANPHVGQVAGRHETPIGGITKFNQRRRAKLKIRVPETRDAGGADDPDKWGLYFYRGATPTKANLKHIGYIGSPTAPSTLTLTGDPTSGHNPPGGIVGQAGAVNNFPGATPGEILSSRNRLDGTPKINLRGNGEANVDGLVPPGTVMMWAGGATPPPGWLLCTGIGISTVNWPDLFAAIGYTFGGSGTTFNIPDFRGRAPVGAGTGRPRGGTGGSETKTLSVSQMPEHAHSMDHGHAGLKNNTSGSSNTTWQAGANNSNNVNTGSGNPVQDYTGNTGTRGSGAPFDVMNPWAAIDFIIKT